jgi:small conductance mechanosensitive channel
MTEMVKKAFDKAGVGIPFPQMDVHLHNNKA